MVFEECDDGNTVSGDGCSSSCAIESNYTCVGGSPTSITVCSYDQALEVKLIDQWKSSTANTVYFYFSIYPPIPALDNISFPESLACTLPNSAFTTNYSNGYLVVAVNYTSTIQFTEANLTFSPSINNLEFFATPSTVAPFTVDPNNNLAAVYYEEGVYKGVQTAEILAYVVAGLGYAGFVGGLAIGRFISVEMMGVVQVAFVGLIVVDYLQPLLAAMAEIGFVNGVNSLFSA
jgi:cysteine-rich repeat protein